jgi:hypothetical protein
LRIYLKCVQDNKAHTAVTNPHYFITAIMRLPVFAIKISKRSRYSLLIRGFLLLRHMRLNLSTMEEWPLHKKTEPLWERSAVMWSAL